jgi:hypothetical protein
MYRAVHPNSTRSFRHPRFLHSPVYRDLHGPWDRLDDDRPFLEAWDLVRPARPYPSDVTKDESSGRPACWGNTVVRRDSGSAPGPCRITRRSRSPCATRRSTGNWPPWPTMGPAVPRACAGALETDGYRPSDMAWLDMKTNTVDVVIGPIEATSTASPGRRPRRNPRPHQGQGVERPAGRCALLRLQTPPVPGLQR